MHNLIKQILMSKVYEVTQVTPLEIMPRLSKRIKTNIWLKREDFHPVFSFKLRGAYNAIAHLDDNAKSLGIVCASAGNHAQGVAYSCHVLKIPATIVMPITAPDLKVQACRNWGANVILFGNSYDEACSHAYALQDAQKLTFVHAFDNMDVIAGQGTIGKEIFEQNQNIDVVFLPIGGGGLAAGIAAYIKFIAPNCRVIGVEPTDASAMHDSLRAQKRIQLSQVGGFADGVAVKIVGEHTFSLCQTYLDDVILVSTDEICAAMKDIFEDTRAIAEPSGALAVAGAKKYLKMHAGFKNAATILSGANINFDRLRFVAERAEIGEKTEAILAITIPETLGSFRQFLEFLGNRNITEFNYRYVSPESATIFVGIYCSEGEPEKNSVIQVLEENHLTVLDLSDNEVAKSHIRYMVGGKAPSIHHERLFRFEFPERPGALKQFLYAMKSHWNITLFHYRNHGADYGRILLGMEVPENEVIQVHQFINDLGYDCIDETNNPAFALFL